VKVAWKDPVLPLRPEVDFRRPLQPEKSIPAPEERGTPKNLEPVRIKKKSGKKAGRGLVTKFPRRTNGGRRGGGGSHSRKIKAILLTYAFGIQAYPRKKETAKGRARGSRPCTKPQQGEELFEPMEWKNLLLTKRKF